MWWGVCGGGGVCIRLVGTSTGISTWSTYYGAMMLSGGQDDQGVVTNTVEILSTEQETWITGVPPDDAVEGPGMAILDGQLVLPGGRPSGILHPPPLKQVLAMTEAGDGRVARGREPGRGRAFAGRATVPPPPAAERRPPSCSASSTNFPHAQTSPPSLPPHGCRMNFTPPRVSAFGVLAVS